MALSNLDPNRQSFFPPRLSFVYLTVKVVKVVPGMGGEPFFFMGRGGAGKESKFVERGPPLPPPSPRGGFPPGGASIPDSDDDDDDDLFNRLAPEMVEDLVTLKCNLHLLREQPSV